MHESGGKSLSLSSICTSSPFVLVVIYILDEDIIFRNLKYNIELKTIWDNIHNDEAFNVNEIYNVTSKEDMAEG